MKDKKTTFSKQLHFNEFPAIETDHWDAVIEKDLKGEDYKTKFNWQSIEGINYLPFYRQEHLKDVNHEIAPLKTGQNEWEVSQHIRHQTISDANKKAQEALVNGASGLVFDLNTLTISSYDDLEVLLKDIYINLIGVHFEGLTNYSQLEEWLQQYVSANDLSVDELTITFSSDVFSKALLSSKLPTYSELQNDVSSRLNSPFKHLHIDGFWIADAGASIAQQIAFIISSLVEQLELAKAQKLDLQQVIDKTHITLGIGSDYFLEIAKFRALRLLWNKVLEVYELEASAPYLRAITLEMNKSTQDPHNNLLRGTTEAMAAAIGGVNSITVRAFDAAYKEANNFSDRMARNIQLILKEEAYLDKVSDPAAGSYYVETLTHKFAEQAWELFKTFEKEGGLHASIKAGNIQSLINETASKRKAAIQNGDIVMIGVNKFEPADGAMAKAQLSLPNFSLESHFECDDIEAIQLLRLAEPFEKEQN
jgi:methylmalonyl-CoA mutase